MEIVQVNSDMAAIDAARVPASAWNAAENEIRIVIGPLGAPL